MSKKTLITDFRAREAGIFLIVMAFAFMARGNPFSCCFFYALLEERIPAVAALPRNDAYSTFIIARKSVMNLKKQGCGVKTAALLNHDRKAKTRRINGETFKRKKCAFVNDVRQS